MNTKFNLKRIVSTVCLAATVMGAVGGAAAPQAAHAYTGPVTSVQPDCQEIEPASTIIRESMLCTYEGNAVIYNVFASSEVMYDFLMAYIPELGLTNLDPGEWHFDESNIEGMLVRGKLKGKAVLIWTHDDTATSGTVISNNANQNALYQWWGEFMGELYL